MMNNNNVLKTIYYIICRYIVPICHMFIPKGGVIAGGNHFHPTRVLLLFHRTGIGGYIGLFHQTIHWKMTTLLKQLRTWNM